VAPLQTGERSLRDLAQTLTAELATELAATGVFALTPASVMTELEPALLRSMRFGCSEIGCVRELAEATKAVHVVTGRLEEDGRRVVISLELREVRRAKIVVSAKSQPLWRADLVAALGGLAAQLAGTAPPPALVAEGIDSPDDVIERAASIGATLRTNLGSNWSFGLGVEHSSTFAKQPLGSLNLGWSPFDRVAFELELGFGQAATQGLRSTLGLGALYFVTGGSTAGGAFVASRSVRERISWTNRVDQARQRRRSELALGWRRVTPEHIVYQAEANAALISGDESPALFGHEAWRTGLRLSVGYLLP